MLQLMLTRNNNENNATMSSNDKNNMNPLADGLSSALGGRLPAPSLSSGKGIGPQESGPLLLTALDTSITIALVTLILISIGGNLLVCVAIFTERRLRKLGNAFIVSLAIADLFVSCFVMTFALCNELLEYWPFGEHFCDLFISLDIMCCTASILNLCAISLDRFIMIKDCLLYNRLMTKRVALYSLLLIWFISALVSFVPITLGWHKPDHQFSRATTSGQYSNQIGGNKAEMKSMGPPPILRRLENEASTGPLDLDEGVSRFDKLGANIRRVSRRQAAADLNSPFDALGSKQLVIRSTSDGEEQESGVARNSVDRDNDHESTSDTLKLGSSRRVVSSSRHRIHESLDQREPGLREGKGANRKVSTGQTVDGHQERPEEQHLGSFSQNTADAVSSATSTEGTASLATTRGGLLNNHDSTPTRAILSQRPAPGAESTGAVSGSSKVDVRSGSRGSDNGEQTVGPLLAEAAAPDVASSSSNSTPSLSEGKLEKQLNSGPRRHSPGGSDRLRDTYIKSGKKSGAGSSGAGAAEKVGSDDDEGPLQNDYDTKRRVNGLAASGQRLLLNERAAPLVELVTEFSRHRKEEEEQDKGHQMTLFGAQDPEMPHDHVNSRIRIERRDLHHNQMANEMDHMESGRNQPHLNDSNVKLNSSKARSEPSTPMNNIRGSSSPSAEMHQGEQSEWRPENGDTHNTWLHNNHQQQIINHHEEAKPQCILTLTPTYAIVSSTISFYIPCLIMIGLYTRLYACAMKHVKSIQSISKAPAPIVVLKRPSRATKPLQDDGINHHSNAITTAPNSALSVGVAQGTELSDSSHTPRQTSHVAPGVVGSSEACDEAPKATESDFQSGWLKVEVSEKSQKQQQILSPEGDGHDATITSFTSGHEHEDQATKLPLATANCKTNGVGIDARNTSKQIEAARQQLSINKRTNDNPRTRSIDTNRRAGANQDGGDQLVKTTTTTDTTTTNAMGLLSGCQPLDSENLNSIQEKQEQDEPNESAILKRAIDDDQETEPFLSSCPSNDNAREHAHVLCQAQQEAAHQEHESAAVTRSQFNSASGRLLRGKRPNTNGSNDTNDRTNASAYECDIMRKGDIEPTQASASRESALATGDKVPLRSVSNSDNNHKLTFQLTSTGSNYSITSPTPPPPPVSSVKGIISKPTIATDLSTNTNANRKNSNKNNNNNSCQKQTTTTSGHLATHKAAITLGIIMGTFLLCWVPFFCINIIKAFNSESITSSQFRFFTWLGYANSALNPIIYGIHNSEFRCAFNRIFFKHFSLKSSRDRLSRRFSHDYRHHQRNGHHQNH